MDYGRVVESRVVVRTEASQKVDYGGGVDKRAVVRTGASPKWMMEQV